MGYSHAWTLHRALTDLEWADVVRDSQRLADDVPRQLQRGPFRPGVALSGRQKLFAMAWRNEQGGGYRTLSPGTLLRDDGLALVVMPWCHDPIVDAFVFARDAHHAWCKTNAQFYDRLAVGVLMVVQRVAPHALTITDTDMEDSHRTALHAWLQDVLGEHEPQPSTSERRASTRRRLKL